MGWLQPGAGNRIRRTVLRDEIKGYILDAILSGSLQAGARIVETQLARHLGVSQAPVREALRELEQMGLLQSEPYRGVSVRSLSQRELAEMYRVRAVLEQMAAEEAVRGLAPAVVDRLAALVEEMVAAARAGDQRRMVALDVALHRTIVEQSGNGFLLRVWELIQPANWTLVTAKMYGPGLVELAERHQEVLDALRAGDPARAGLVMRRHIEELADQVAAMAAD